MKKAWVALREAVQELNQTLLIDSDEEEQQRQDTLQENSETSGLRLAFAHHDIGTLSGPAGRSGKAASLDHFQYPILPHFPAESPGHMLQDASQRLSSPDPPFEVGTKTSRPNNSCTTEALNALTQLQNDTLARCLQDLVDVASHPASSDTNVHKKTSTTPPLQENGAKELPPPPPPCDPPPSNPFVSRPLHLSYVEIGRNKDILRDTHRPKEDEDAFAVDPAATSVALVTRDHPALPLLPQSSTSSQVSPDNAVVVSDIQQPTTPTTTTPFNERLMESPGRLLRRQESNASLPELLEKPITTAVTSRRRVSEPDLKVVQKSYSTPEIPLLEAPPPSLSKLFQPTSKNVDSSTPPPPTLDSAPFWQDTMIDSLPSQKNLSASLLLPPPSSQSASLPSASLSTNSSTSPADTANLQHRNGTSFTPIEEENIWLRNQLHRVVKNAQDQFCRYRDVIQSQQKQSFMDLEQQHRQQLQELEATIQRETARPEPHPELHNDETLRHIQAELDDLNRVNQQLMDQLATWERKYTALAEDYNQQHEELQTFQKTNAELRLATDQLDIMQQRLDTLNNLSQAAQIIESENAQLRLIIKDHQDSLAAKSDIITRLNTLIQDINPYVDGFVRALQFHWFLALWGLQRDHDATVATLRTWLTEARDKAVEATSKLTEFQDQQTELETLRRTCAQLQEGSQKTKADLASLQKENDILNEALKKALDRLRAHSVEAEHFIDRRDIVAALASYYQLLSKRGTVSIIGRSRDQMTFVLCRTCHLPVDAVTQYLGLDTTSLEAEVREQRRLGHNSSVSCDDDSVHNRTDSFPNPTPQRSVSSHPQASRRPISTLFLEFLEAEANR